MGTWGPGLFDDDLALDVRGGFERAVAGGASPAEAAAGLLESELTREILEEFGEGERDDMFWEENRGLFYAIASLQLEHGVLHEVVRQQALQAIAVERRGLDPEQQRERWEVLDALEAKLGSAAAAPPRHRLAEGTNPALQVARATTARPPAKKKKPAPRKKKPAPKKKPPARKDKKKKKKKPTPAAKRKRVA